MKKRNKKYVIIISVALLLALIVFCVIIPIRKKTIAPTLSNTPAEGSNNEGTIDVTVPNDEPATSDPSAAEKPASTNPTEQVPAEAPANPDSSASITSPQTTDYSNVTGSQFDDRN